MGILRRAGNTIEYETFGEKIIISPYGKNRIRFRSSANLQISEEKWTLLEPEDVPVSIEVSQDEAIMRNGRITARIDSYGVVKYCDEKGGELLSELWVDDGSKPPLMYYGREYRHKGGGMYETKVYFKPYKVERLYGLGQDPNDCLDLKGTTSELWQKNSRVSIPFLLSSRGYGFLWNNPAVGRVETVYNHTLWYMEAAKQVDYIVIADDTPAGIVRQLSEITGRAPRFPEWASGFWQCKLRYETQEDLLNVAREYKRRNIPISAIIVDFFHWTEQGEWKFDPRYWPDPKAMVDELAQMGIRLIVSVWPTVDGRSEHCRAMKDRNYVMKAETGFQGLLDCFGAQTFVDTTYPEAREFVWSIIKKNYYDNGIKSFWLDMAEPELHPAHFDNMKMYLGNGLQINQLYSYTYAQMFYEGLKKEGETEIINLCRSAWFGSQRLGVLVWSGDVASSFDSLRRQVKAGLNMSLCGIPWWTTDIGGFGGGCPSDSTFRELLVRWFQYAVFLPVTRMHGYRVWEEGKGSAHPEMQVTSGADNEIWSFGEAVYEILKDLIFLREKLRPYIAKHMEKASADGTPLIRPMFFDYPGDEICYTLDDQYMFGDDVLVAPVVEMGCRERAVYLPEGKWVRLGERDAMDGGRSIVCEAPLDKVTAFIRQGSDLVGLLEA